MEQFSSRSIWVHNNLGLDQFRKYINLNSRSVSVYMILWVRSAGQIGSWQVCYHGTWPVRSAGAGLAASWSSKQKVALMFGQLKRGNNIHSRKERETCAFCHIEFRWVAQLENTDLRTPRSQLSCLRRLPESQPVCKVSYAPFQEGSQECKFGSL